MALSMPIRVRKRGVWSLQGVVVLLLCFSVIVQMLGVPVTLLNPGAAADAPDNSVLEGFSVPPSVAQIAPFTKVRQVAEIPPVVLRPTLISTLFHPPLSAPLG